MLRAATSSSLAGLLALLAACAGAGEGRTSGATFGVGGSGGAGTAADDAGTATDEPSADDTADGTGEGGGCPGECEPSQLQSQACPGGAAEQHRVCNDDCTFSPWSECPDPMAGVCTPGQTQDCGECMQQVCDPAGQWGPCEMSCAFVCQDSARNGAEICDDQAFDMPNGPLYLVCVSDEGGVGYVAHNTGPVQRDGIPRCQGWEDNDQNAWEFLDYEQTMDCDMVNKSMLISLAPGTTGKWYGVHTQPDGSGGSTEVCIATLR